MTADECELLDDIDRVCRQAGLFMLEFRLGHLTAVYEEAYAFQLIDVAEGLLRHARNRNRQ